MLTYLILFLALAFLSRTSGQVSLCHVTFAAIGAVAFSKLTIGAGFPWLIALLIAGLTAVPFGAMLAIPAVRFSGLYLALSATLGFGLLVQNMFYNSSLMFTVSESGVALRMPHLSWLSLELQTEFYYVVLIMAGLSAAAIVVLARSRLGRILRGVSEPPVAISTAGANVAVASVLAFCIAAFFAALAGALGGMVLQQVTGADYSPLTSLTYMALIMIVVGDVPWNAGFAAAAGIGLLPAYITSPNTNNYLSAGFGIAAVFAALGLQGGLFPARWRIRVDEWGDSLRAIGRPYAYERQLSPRSARVAKYSTRPLELKVLGLTVRFGGLVAVDDVALTAQAGRITGLIGPNGAGKTSTFNACSGLVRPASGRVLLDGADVSSVGPSGRGIPRYRKNLSAGGPARDAERSTEH